MFNRRASIVVAAAAVVVAVGATERGSLRTLQEKAPDPWIPNTDPPRIEGIQVHGDWEIEVVRPDGTMRERVEFENALTSEGAEFLARILDVGLNRACSGSVVFPAVPCPSEQEDDDGDGDPLLGDPPAGPWVVAVGAGPVVEVERTIGFDPCAFLTGAARQQCEFVQEVARNTVSEAMTPEQPCGTDASPSRCTMTELFVEGNWEEPDLPALGQLVVDAEGGAVVFRGEVRATRSGEVGMVSTQFRPVLSELVTFTETSVSPPVAVEEDDIIQVRVTISFS